MNKGLETFQLLLLERRGDSRRVAATVMDPQVSEVFPTLGSPAVTNMCPAVSCHVHMPYPLSRVSLHPPPIPLPFFPLFSQATSLGTRVTVRELVKLLQITR